MTFVLTVSMVLGLVPIDGLMKVAYASETTYSITIADGIINGTVTADKTKAVKGETVTLTISPDDLYELYDLSVKCGENAVPFYWATTSFVMPDGDVTVNVSFKKKTTYTTFFKYSGKTFSKTTPNGESSTFELTDVLDALLETTTDEINNVEVNGSCISASQQDNKWMLTTYYGGDSFESNAVLKVTVGDSEYSIDISASQDSIPVIIQGSVRFDANGGSGTMEAMSGRTDKFFVLPECSFTPPDGMEFDTWKIGSDYYPEGTTYRWKESVIAYAQWKDIEGVNSTIVSNSEPSKGSLVVSPTKALPNTNIVLTPQPANGYVVDSISYSYEGSGTLQPTANQDGTYSFSMPDKNVTVTITFKEDTAVSIPYLDANGNNANCTSNSYVSESDTTWNTGWYVVNRTLTINNRIVVDGNVNLILADGATLNAQSGITVYGNNSLNIFAQSTGENKGKLCADATQKPNYAAIGGANSEETMNCGSVNIYGGYIEAHGGQNSAGIGGGDVSAYKGGSGGTITINAGTIKSYGGNWYGAGIGGGRHGNGGIIRINGGYVETYGNYGAAGIGGGLDGESGIITITGGTVLAKGSICEGYKPEWGAGIGSGRDAEANRIEITGGNITAYGASDSAAIGSGRNRKCNEIIISGGVVNAIAYSTNDVGIGSSRSSTSTGTISLSWTNGSVDEINSSSYKGTVTLEKAFVDKLDSTVSFEAGDLSDNSAIGGKTIVPHDSSAHYHRFTYVVSQDGKTITATCGNSGCSLTNNAATLTIAAPTGSLVYNGSAKAATITGDTSVLGTPTITYKKGNTSLGSTAPKNAGTYTASITLGSGSGAATASVGFTITAQPITIPTATAGLKWTGNEQTGVADASGYTVTDGKATAVGSYTATVTLKDKTNTKWSDGTTDDQSIEWSIAKADGPAAPTGLVGAAPTTNGDSDGKITGVDGKMEYSGNSSFTSKTDCAGTEITGLSAGTYYVRVKETETHEAGDYVTVKVPAYVAPTYEVTYKVVNGTWSDDSTTNKTETVQSGSKPASVPTGMKAGSGYMGGAWDTDPADATITGATTFTYTFSAIPTYTVTYKVVGGTWSDDSTTNKTETVQSGSKPVSVPTGMKAGSGYMGGAWDTDPADATITGATTFTYTFSAIPTYTVTYKVVGGTWSDDSTTNKTEIVQSGSKPASVPTGMKAGSGYMGGAWDTDPAEATITGATTFTYSFTAKQAAIVKKAPTAKTLTYTGSAQKLVTAGEATGGTMYYAANTENTAPADNLYTTSIPAKTEVGTYYVWYKVVGDENHNDVEPECLAVSIKEKEEQKPSDGTITTDGIYCASNHPSIQAGMVIHKSNEADTVEYRWVACDSNKPGEWFEVSPWTKNNNCIDWTPEKSGSYVIVCYARVVGNEKKSEIQYAFGTEYHKEIKGICQMPYSGEGGGYLIGIESYNNPNNSYQYEILILDCSLLAQGKDAWIYTTGRCGANGNSLWTVWQPKYGYYWTLFRIYDSNGNLLDEVCYGFENVN